MRTERSFRGITVRLAVHYLEGLGGTLERREGDLAEPGARAVVAGDCWRATLASTAVDVGPSLTLTEVDVAFEGDADALDGLVPAFERKAMRAGG